MIKFFEYLRIILVTLGLVLAYIFPARAAYFLLCGMTLPMYGLLTIQVFFFPQQSADYLKRQSSVYTRYQAGAFWLSVFLVGLGALIFHAAVAVQLTLVILTAIGFLLSGLVHLWEYLKEAQAPRVHLWRIVGSVLLCVYVLIAIWPTLFH
jgi:uncharacterized membrane protein